MQPFAYKGLAALNCYTLPSHARARVGGEGVTNKAVQAAAARLPFTPHPWQLKAAQALTNGRDVAAIVPTSGGKSLPPQILALAQAPLGGGLILVLSPLLALSADQVVNAAKLGIRAERFDSTVDAKAKAQILDRILVNDFQVLFTTPESLSGSGWLSKRLREVLKRHLWIAVVDEGHYCLSARSYRSAYGKIGQILTQLQPHAIYVCTATSEPWRQEALFQACALKDPLVIRHSPARPNLSFKHCARSPEQLIELLDRHQGERVIIYTATVRLGQELVDRVRLGGRQVGIYHGQLTDKQKAASQTEFAEKQVHHLVATDAFGLGVNYPDIRAVVCYDPADSVSGFVQHAGRAGRDGLPSTIYVCSMGDPGGWQSRDFLIEMSYPAMEDIARLWRFVANQNRWVPGHPAAISEMAALEQPKYRGPACISWLKRKSLVLSRQNSENKRRSEWRSVGDFDKTDWSDHEWERNDAIAALRQLKELLSLPEREIPCAIIRHFEGDLKTQCGTGSAVATGVELGNCLEVSNHG